MSLPFLLSSRLIYTPCSLSVFTSASIAPRDLFTRTCIRSALTIHTYLFTLQYIVLDLLVIHHDFRNSAALGNRCGEIVDLPLCMPLYNKNIHILLIFPLHTYSPPNETLQIQHHALFYQHILTALLRTLQTTGREGGGWRLIWGI